MQELGTVFKMLSAIEAAASAHSAIYIYISIYTIYKLCNLI